MIFVEVLGGRLVHLKQLRDNWLEYLKGSSSESSHEDSGRWHILVCDPVDAESIEEIRTEQEKRKDRDDAEFGQDSSMEDSDQVTDDDDNISIDTNATTPSYKSCLEKKKMITEQLERMPRDKLQRLIGHSSERDLSWLKLQDPFVESPSRGHFKNLNRCAYMRVIHLGLLRTCRQVYTEANRVLWQTNTFSFNDAHSFSCFMGERNNHQKGFMKKLRLAMNLFSGSGPLWSRRLTLPLVEPLQGLRYLWLAIHYRQTAARFEEIENAGLLESDISHSMHLDGIRALATLPLTWVKVSVTNKDLGDFDPSDNTFPRQEQWTQQQREKYARLIRTRLLDVDGVKLWQQEDEQFKASMVRAKEIFQQANEQFKASAVRAKERERRQDWQG